jgi:hypothetical protein
MYLVNFGLLKNLESTNDHLEIEKFEKNLDLGATQQCFLSQDDPTNICFQCFVSNLTKNLILTTKFKKLIINNLIQN